MKMATGWLIMRSYGSNERRNTNFAAGKKLLKINVLAFGAHNDVELGAGGILATHAMRGLTTGIDLSRGEMGTRGTPELKIKRKTQPLY